jgi:hypothetical protein
VTIDTASIISYSNRLQDYLFQCQTDLEVPNSLYHIFLRLWWGSVDEVPFHRFVCWLQGAKLRLPSAEENHRSCHALPSLVRASVTFSSIHWLLVFTRSPCSSSSRSLDRSTLLHNIVKLKVPHQMVRDPRALPPCAISQPLRPALSPKARLRN